MQIDDSHDHFRAFASSLETVIGRYGDQGLTLDLLQKQQIEMLVDLENQFRQALISHRYGVGVYKAFLAYICDERRSILAARPFFRERQTTFTAEISEALKQRADKSLYRFRFNYQFVRFSMRARKWAPGSKLTVLARQIETIRQEIIETNIPLAISRARIFWSRTQKSHLSYMDLVQIASEGLIAAVDKFVPPFRTVFRSVAIGRMTGNLIEDYSDTMLHFYPKDARRIYRAHKLLGRNVDSVIDYDHLADEVNENVEEGHKVAPQELSDLLAAASCVSMDVPADTEVTEHIERFAAPDSARPDVQFEEYDSFNQLKAAYEQLSLLEQKLLRLRGVSIPL